MVQSEATGSWRKEIASPRDKAPGKLVKHFQSSYQVAESLHLPRKSSDSSQSALQRARELQLSYVVEARDAPKLLPEDLVQHQLALAGVSTLDAVIEFETPSARQRRDAHREGHLEGLQSRHNKILQQFDVSAAELHAKLHEEVDTAIRNLAQSIKEADTTGASLLNEFSCKSNIGNEKEQAIQDLLTELESCTSSKKQIVQHHSQFLQDVELSRRSSFLELIQEYITHLNGVAHVSRGEVQRWGDEKCMSVNEVLLANAKERSEFVARLQARVVSDHKVWRSQWYELLNTWKRLRHRRALSIVFSRIHSREFIHPVAISCVLSRMTDVQVDTFQNRLQVVAELFDTPAEAILSHTCRNNEELLNRYNDSAQESYDTNFAELKRVKDGLNEEGFQMLRELEMQVDNLDARKEWGSHDGANELVEVDVAPHLTKRLDFVSQLLMDVSSVLQDMDEAQHYCCINVVKFFGNLALMLDKFKNELNDFRVQHQGELDDKVEDHERECEQNEQRMSDLHDVMDDTAHLDLLDDRLQNVFDHLDTIEASYRTFEKDMVAIHSRFESECTALFERHVLVLALPLGLGDGGITPVDIPNEAGIEQQFDEAAESFAEHGGSSVLWLPAADAAFSFLLSESISVQDLRGQLMRVPVSDSNGEIAKDDVEENDARVDISDKGQEQIRIPRGSDGKQCIHWLYVHHQWLESRLEKIRTTVFTHLQERFESEQHQGAVALAQAEEELSRQLEERLRRHVNRRGEVQVEWFQPRKQQIEKHREVLRRHFLFIATKNSNHDRQFQDVKSNFFMFAEEYSTGLNLLAADLSQADSLAFLTSIERKAKDLFSKFQDGQRKLLSVLRVITEQATYQLKANNDDFLKMCSPAEKYSISEVSYFREQMGILNESIDGLISSRRSALDELTEKAASLAEDPLTEFSTQHAAAVENLCKRDGLGRTYGAPRRAAQEQIRSLIARAQNASRAVGVFFENYFSKLAFHGSEGPSEEDLLCPGSFRRTRLYPMPCAMELRGGYTVAASAVRILCRHLGALLPEFETKLAEPAIIPCLLDEASFVRPTYSGNDDGDVEDSVVKGAMHLILGNVVTSISFQEIVSSVREQAMKQFNNSLPHFMSSALSAMEASAQKNRQDICRELRRVCDQLRGDSSIACARQVFNDLDGRSLESLICRLGSREKIFRDRFLQSKLLRNQHEKELRPSLANPQCVHLLNDLKLRESQRHEAFLADIVAVHADFKKIFVEESNFFLCSAHASMEAHFAVMDTIPLWPHFVRVPGDEQLTQARMSIKRLQRRKANGEEGPIDQTGQFLPPRVWEGVPGGQLRLHSSWDGSILEDGAGPPEAVELNDTASINSYRSSAHKALFAARNRVFQSFVDVFQARQKQLMSLVHAKLVWERSGQSHWDHMLNRLLAGVVDESDV